MAGSVENGGGDPPSEDEGSENKELQSANETMVSGDPRSLVFGKGFIHIDLDIAAVMRDASYLLGDQVQGGLLLSNILWFKVTSGGHPVRLNLCSRW